MKNDSARRPCTWADVAGLHNLNARIAADTGLGPNAHIGDLYWALRATPNDDLFRGMSVWTRPDSSLAAAAWLDPPATGDAIVAPEADMALIDEVVAWLEEETRAAGGETLSIIVRVGDRGRIDTLRRRGYAPSDAGNLRLTRHMVCAPDPVVLPLGFALHHVATAADIHRRAFVESTSFEVMTVTADRWRLLRRLPTYDPQLDLIVVAPDGTGVSGCTGWYDGGTRCGEIEAVGTSRTFQRMGLGKALITEALRRLYTRGATQAILYTSIGNEASAALYRTCGFDVVASDFAWLKRL